MSSGIPGQQWRLASMAPPARKQQAQTAEPTTPPPPSSPPHTHTHNTAHSPPASHLGDLLRPAQLVEQQVQEVGRQRRGRDRGLQARPGRHALLHHRAKRRVARGRAACGAPGSSGRPGGAQRLAHCSAACHAHGQSRGGSMAARHAQPRLLAGSAGGRRRAPCALRRPGSQGRTEPPGAPAGGGRACWTGAPGSQCVRAE